MIFLVVLMLVIAACAALPMYLERKNARRDARRRELPPLIFPMPGPDRHVESAHLSPREDGALASGRDDTLKRALPLSSDTVHFRRPSDEALQLLPGRLQVLSGLALPREIRFVRVPGERAQLILGREPGNSPQHVSLPSSTVSREHARLDFADGRWGLTNLSRTNPVVVNDETLSNGAGERALVDGDRIELGDVVLRFCAH